jgi:hypothetical protein
MRLLPAAALSGLLMMALGCMDLRGSKAGPGPGPAPQQLQMDPVWVGKTLYAGQAAVTVQAPPARSGLPGAFAWTLQGSGSLQDPGGAATPTGASVKVSPSTTSGGSTLVLGATFYPSCGCTPEVYANLSLPIQTVTSPMAVAIGGGSLDASHQETLTVGAQDTFVASATPVPPGFSPAWTIQSVTPSVPDAGTLTPGAVYANGTAAPATYKTPASAPSDFDVVIAASAADPWFGGSAAATATIHVKH